MKPKLLVAALTAAGVIAAAPAWGWSFNPGHWFSSETPASSVARTPDTSGPTRGSAVTRLALAPTDTPATQDATGSKTAEVAPVLAPDWAGVVARFGPAVVGIQVEGMREVGNADAPDISRDPFFRFFRGLPIPHMPQGEVPVRGLGSGFIVSADGLILTNAHVVRDADRVRVKLADRREFDAKVLGSDPATDVAVLKIDASGLPNVHFGTTDALRVGDYVLAIGAPFGFEQSATSGIVSAKGRSLPGDAYVPFIQTDVAVNPGNSGGPLFDAAGRVVGINAQIYSRTGGYEGLSFAIPIDVALRIRDQIVETGEARHAQLGVTVQELDQALADSFDLKSPAGALVSQISPDSAAARAGLRPGDVILAFNGQPIERSGDLAARVGMSRPGASVTLDVVRDGKHQEIRAVLGEAQSGQVAAETGSAHASGTGRIGLAVRALDRNERASAHIEHGGLLVENVSGAARRAGIRPGDVILSVNGQPVDSVDALRKRVDQGSNRIALLIQRGETRIFVPLDLG